VSLPRLLLSGLLLTLAAAGTSGADAIVLTSGRVIQADHAWYQGKELRYRLGTTVYRLPRARVARVEAQGEGALLDPDVLESRSRLAAGDAEAALGLARIALFRDPESVPALQALAAAQLGVGDARRAQATAEQAIGRDGHDARSLELLGDALTELGEVASAREQYRTALELGPNDRIEQKLDALAGYDSSTSNARFRVQFDGAADQPMGTAVLGVLDAAWDEYQKRLGMAPGVPVTVVLQTARTFQDTTRAPIWAAALNDGAIRVPVQGLDELTPGLVRVLRHELAHSFVAAHTHANCPTWLHEGFAQWLEGGDPSREDKTLGPAARSGRLLRLDSLELPFVGLSEKDATVAYAQSLSAVAYLLKRKGEVGLRSLLDALASGQPASEALMTTYALSYADLQREWEGQLKATTGPSVRGAGL
jgi:hypothetical protein